MTIRIDIDEDKVDNLSDGARSTFNQQIEKYADDIIKEANLIEEAIRENGANAEITSNIILQAVRKNKTIYGKKTDIGIIIIKIVSSFSLLITGFLFDSSGYQNNLLKFLLFILFLIIASVSTVLQFINEVKE